MSDKAPELTLYRCLRSAREVKGGLIHDECEDIIQRNPHVDFRPGLTGVEVDHKVYGETYWDADPDNFAKTYLEIYEGRLGYIMVSLRLDLLRAANLPWEEDPRFYHPHYLRRVENRHWYVADLTALIKVRVEKVVEPKAN